LTSKTLELLRRQAAWQRQRRHLSWEEKIRLAEEVLPGLLVFDHRGKQKKLATLKKRPMKLGGSDPRIKPSGILSRKISSGAAAPCTSLRITREWPERHGYQIHHG